MGMRRREELVLVVTGSLSDDKLIQPTSAVSCILGAHTVVVLTLLPLAVYPFSQLWPKCYFLWFNAGNIYRRRTYDGSPRNDWWFNIDERIHTLVTRGMIY